MSIELRLPRGGVGVGATVEQRALAADGTLSLQPRPDRGDSPFERRSIGKRAERRTRDDRLDSFDQPAPPAVIVRVTTEGDSMSEHLLANEAADLVDE